MRSSSKIAVAYLAMGLAGFLLLASSCIKSQERNNPFDPLKITATPTPTQFILVDDFQDGNWKNAFSHSWTGGVAYGTGTLTGSVATTGTGANLGMFMSGSAAASAFLTDTPVTIWYGGVLVLSTVDTINLATWTKVGFDIKGTADTSGSRDFYAYAQAPDSDEFISGGFGSAISVTWNTVNLPFSNFTGLSTNKSHPAIANETSLDTIGFLYDIKDTTKGNTGAFAVVFDNIKFY